TRARAFYKRVEHRTAEGGERAGRGVWAGNGRKPSCPARGGRYGVIRAVRGGPVRRPGRGHPLPPRRTVGAPVGGGRGVGTGGGCTGTPQARTPRSTPSSTGPAGSSSPGAVRGSGVGARVRVRGPVVAEDGDHGVGVADKPPLCPALHGVLGERGRRGEDGRGEQQGESGGAQDQAVVAGSAQHGGHASPCRHPPHPTGAHSMVPPPRGGPSSGRLGSPEGFPGAACKSGKRSGS